LTDSYAPDKYEERTVQLTDNLVRENVIALNYGDNLMDELTGLSQSRRLFDVVIIDCTLPGFWFTAETFIQCAELAKHLLEVQGAMLFVKADKATAFVKESVVGDLAFHVFETLSQVYDYSPALARQIQQTLGKKTDIADDTTDLSEQILMSSVPVLTNFGIKLKAGMESNRRRNIVLSAIDNYSAISSISQKVSAKVSFDELLDEIRGLEDSGAIYPFFARIPYLVHSFRNKLPFKLKDYLQAAKLLTSEQIDSLFVAMHSNKSEHLSLGTLAVTRGLLSSRQLEIALQDQAFYGQGGEERVKVLVDQDQESKVHSLVGHLGNTDPAGLLQSLANNRENGVLSVEHKDLTFRAIFEQGKLTKAKQSKLKGNAAVTEFVSVWKEGVFVFLDRQAPADLTDDSCNVSRPLDKLLLDSALASDNIETLYKKLPAGGDTSLEKVEDTNGLLVTGAMVDPQEGYQLSPEDINVMIRLWREFDGLQSIRATIKKLGDITTSQACAAITRLMHYNLATVPGTSLSKPLEIFQAIIVSVANRVGVDRSNALLRLSLQASQGYSARARMFQIGSAGEVGVDLILARSAGVSLTEVVKQLEDWQVSYIEYASQELDKTVLRDIVSTVFRDAEQNQPQRPVS
jgi:hypothetical protein